jgi:hypothetical protein
MKLSQIKANLQPIVTKTFEEKIKKAHQDKNEESQKKPLYKMKIFNGVESKVMQNLNKKREKSLKNGNLSEEKKPKFYNDSYIDNLINHVEEDIKKMK